MSAPTEQQHLDPVIAGAIEQARAAAVEMAGTEVGAHLGVRAEGDSMATHAFAAELPGYRGWHWAVTMVRVPECEPTVAEVVLLPGDGALLARPWVPWSERLQPGDLSPGDLLITPAEDPRLVPAYLASDDPQVEQVSFELGVGRVRVLSRSGRLDAADRWVAGEQGPDTPMAKQAPAHCGTCGYFLSLTGSLSAAFGVCANEYAGADGRVVSVEFGCGAHSETVAEPAVDELGEVYEDEVFDLEPAEPTADASIEASTEPVSDGTAAEPATDGTAAEASTRGGTDPVSEVTVGEPSNSDPATAEQPRDEPTSGEDSGPTG